ncbi:alpha/beta hydrolase [Ponticaulis profundi]|uniref:Alpha/beta hydrolase n=1 Tax=Ponticaulis profundi TaxID=2665222 RepID=A0ABW1S4T0_9PROT
MSFQATLVRLMLKLPPGILVKIAGGRPVQLGGRTLDPHFQFLANGAASQPPMSSLSAQDARAGSAAGLAMFATSLPDGVTSEDSEIVLEDRTIPTRVYKPADQDPNMPLMVFYHFGGGVIGDLDTSHAFCGMMAKICRLPIVSVDYRLAPEHKWPAGLDDAVAAYEWALLNADSFGALPGQAMVAGDSMGGNFAAIVAQEMKREHKPQPVFQLLIYPATDVASDTPSMHLFGDSYPLTRDTMEWFMQHYMPDDADPEDPRLSPIHEMQLDGLAPAIVATAGFDPLVDQGKAYADRLSDAGVDVDYRCYDSLAHGFTAFVGVAPAAKKACEEICMLLKDKLKELH